MHRIDRKLPQARSEAAVTGCTDRVNQARGTTAGTPSAFPWRVPAHPDAEARAPESSACRWERSIAGWSHATTITAVTVGSRCAPATCRLLARPRSQWWLVTAVASSPAMLDVTACAFAPTTTSTCAGASSRANRTTRCIRVSPCRVRSCLGWPSRVLPPAASTTTACASVTCRARFAIAAAARRC